MAEDTRKPLQPDLPDPVDSEVALAEDATASEEDSRGDVAVGEASVAAIVDSEAAAAEASAEVATVALAHPTDMVHLLMLPLAQVPVDVPVVTEVTGIVTTPAVVVGMTPAVADAHMMTDPADVTAAVSATETDEVAPTMSPSVTVDHENIVTTTDPEKTTAGNAGTRAATKTRESSAGTSGSSIKTRSRRVLVGILPSSVSSTHVLSACLSFCLLTPRVSKGKIHNASPA